MVSFQPVFRDVYCDVGGEAIFERIYSGEYAQVSVDLVRYNETVLQSIQTRAVSSTFPLATAGYDNPGMIGTLMLVEGAAYTLYLRFPFAAKAPFAAAMGLNTGGPLLAGYRFLYAVMDPETVYTGSATPKKVHLSWTCLRAFNPADTNAFGFGGFTLYDSNLAEIAGLPLN